jgi:hypothetical protein
MKGVLPWLVRWACLAGTRDFCSALAALVGAVQYIFFPHFKLFQFLCPPLPASWAVGRQPCWVACLSMCLCLRQMLKYVNIILYKIVRENIPYSTRVWALAPGKEEKVRTRVSGYPGELGSFQAFPLGTLPQHSAVYLTCTLSICASVHIAISLLHITYAASHEDFVYFSVQKSLLAV